MKFGQVNFCSPSPKQVHIFAPNEVATQTPLTVNGH